MAIEQRWVYHIDVNYNLIGKPEPQPTDPSRDIDDRTADKIAEALERRKLRRGGHR